MAVVLHLDGFAAIGQRYDVTRHVVDIVSRILLHEGIEVAVAHLILIGQVDTELVD